MWLYDIIYVYMKYYTGLLLDRNMIDAIIYNIYIYYVIYIEYIAQDNY